MPHTTVIAYCEADGSVPVLEWLEVVETEQPRGLKKCLQRIRMLEREGFELKEPFVKPIGPGLFELRAQAGTVNFRIAFFFHDGRAVLTNGFTKTDELPESAKKQASRSKKAFEQDPVKHTAQLG